jgi:hypothetical protein
MKVQVKAKDHFTHGRVMLARGETHEGFNKLEAEDLAKRGLVEIVGDVAGSDDADDLLGGDKMEAAHDNKMAGKAANKSAKRGE